MQVVVHVERFWGSAVAVRVSERFTPFYDCRVDISFSENQPSRKHKALELTFTTPKPLNPKP